MVDWDTTLAYKTVKFARVLDWRLGALHYFFQFLVGVYIVAYTLLLKKEYLRTETPAGTVRVGLQRPEPCPYEGNCRGFQQNATGLPYCVDFTGVRPPNMLMNESYSCRYADQNFAVWPPVEQRGVLVATRVTTSSEQLPNGCASTGGSLPVPDCYLWQTLYNTTYYIAQLEYFTAFVDHTMTAASIGLALGWQSDSMDCRGLIDIDGNKVNVCDDYEEGHCPSFVRNWCAKTTRNIFPIQSLLRAAKIPDLDTFGDSSCTPSANSPGCESGRYAGLILQVNIEYNNKWSFDTSKVEYSYKVRHVQNAEFKAEEVLWDVNATSRIVNNRHGIRIVFTQIGEIGVFDFQTLLINLVTAMGLLAVSTTAVDYCMEYVLPHRKFYTAAKYNKVMVPGHEYDSENVCDTERMSSEAENVQIRGAAVADTLQDPLLLAPTPKDA